ncbi:hypothetical protein B0H11DRAFT_2232393 [Mycena galericulata]|nr:hypothetical protein B0H11DRAFT_2232393 [Mycena galericulata]
MPNLSLLLEGPGLSTDGYLERGIGFTPVSESVQLLTMMKMVPRGVSSTADADVSRFVVYETTTASVAIQSTQLDIETVAAGGRSCLTFHGRLLLAGPHSTEFSPACYRKGCPMAVTDANLLLRRLMSSFFLKISA